MNLENLDKMLLANKGYAKENEKYDLKIEVADMLISGRIIKGFTQSRLAESIGTKQSSIARMENGNSLPSLSILERIAEAYETDLITPRFGFMDANYKPLQVGVLQTQGTMTTETYKLELSVPIYKLTSGVSIAHDISNRITPEPHYA